MTRRIRLDSELVRRGLARSREQAAQLIDDGRVTVGGQLARKPATQVDTASPIVVAASDDGPDYVSRGAHKLLGALDTFRSLTVEGRRCLDAGASTGGFTDVLLRRGAAHVLAVDVGYGQLAWSLRTDERVTVMERVNVRDLTPGMVGEPPTLIVGDLSFISLRLVLPALAAVAAPRRISCCWSSRSSRWARTSSGRAASCAIPSCGGSPCATPPPRPGSWG